MHTFSKQLIVKKIKMVDEFDMLKSKIRDYDFPGLCDGLKYFKNINYQDPDGNTLMHFSVEFCNYPALLYLMNKKGNVSMANKDQMTPLHMAIHRGFLPLSAALLQAGASVNVQDNNSRTPLYIATRRGDINAVKLLLDFGADPNLTCQAQSLLSVAATYGHSEVMSLLIEFGARYDVGSIPPYIAVLKSGSRPALEVLLKHRPKDVVNTYNDKSILTHAIIEKTSLLPVIAKKYKEEVQRMASENNPSTPKFPPDDLTPPQLRRLNTALERNDSVQTTAMMEVPPKPIRSIWYALNRDTSTFASSWRSPHEELRVHKQIMPASVKSDVIVDGSDSDHNQNEHDNSQSTSKKKVNI